MKREGSLLITKNPLQESRNRRPRSASFQFFWWLVRHESPNPCSRSPGRPQTCHFRISLHPHWVLPVSSAGSCGKVNLRLKDIHGSWESFLAQAEANPGDSSPLILRHLAPRANHFPHEDYRLPARWRHFRPLGGCPNPDVMSAPLGCGRSRGWFSHLLMEKCSGAVKV